MRYDNKVPENTVQELLLSALYNKTALDRSEEQQHINFHTQFMQTLELLKQLIVDYTRKCSQTNTQPQKEANILNSTAQKYMKVS